MPERDRSRYRRDKANGLVAVVIRVDEETHQEIARLAARAGTSWSEQVRLLIEWGLMEQERGG
jgi:predicted transcriptional regulator